jgi:hypothetical protein
MSKRTLQLIKAYLSSSIQHSAETYGEFRNSYSSSSVLRLQIKEDAMVGGYSTRDITNGRTISVGKLDETTWKMGGEYF